MSVSVGGGGLSLLDQFNLEYSDDSVVDVQVDQTSPIVLAKWKITYSQNVTHLNLVAMFGFLDAFIHSVSGGLNGVVLEEQSSIDDITYNRDFYVQTDTDAYSGGAITGAIIAFKNNASTTAYIRVVAYNVLATDHYQISKKRFQMIGSGLYDGVITRLI